MAEEYEQAHLLPELVGGRETEANLSLSEKDLPIAINVLTNLAQELAWRVLGVVEDHRRRHQCLQLNHSQL